MYLYGLLKGVCISLYTLLESQSVKYMINVLSSHYIDVSFIHVLIYDDTYFHL